MFKPKSDAIKIGQDSFKIPARNGTQFGPDSILRFDITRQCGFIDAASSYLECEIELTNSGQAAALNAAQPMLNLERDIGASSLINQMTIRAEGGRVVEELVNYNTYAKIHYNATKTEGALNRRSKLEACSNSYMPQDNSFYSANRIIPSIPAQGAFVGGLPVNGLLNANECYKPIRRKVCLPLLGGIFQNPRSFPAMMIPLEIEMILENSLRAMRICNYGDGVNALPCADIPNDQPGAAGSAARRTLRIQARAQFNTPGGANASGIVPSNGQQPLEGEQQLNALNNCWFRVGQTIRITGDGEFVNSPNAVAIGGGFSEVVCDVTSVVVLDTGAGAAGDGSLLVTVNNDLSGGAAAAGTNIVTTLLSATGTPLATGGNATGHGNFGYTVYNPRLVINKVVPPPAVVQSISGAIAKGQYNQDIISYTNINNAIPGSQSVSTNVISADLSRVKSILSVPTSQANTDNITNGNSLQGQYLDATRYIYQFNTKLVPDRRVDLTVENFPVVVQTPVDFTLKPYRLGSFTSGFHRYEVEKALRSADINVKNLHFITNNPSTTDVVANNFNASEPGSWLVARSMGAGVGTSANMVGKSLVLYLDYNAANQTPVKLLKNFLVHVRTISVGMDGVNIFY